jgi:hypothetical protein
MVNTSDSIGHAFVVNKITIEAEPVTHNVTGPLDYIGQLVDLSRLDGEKYKNYKHRVLDVYVNRANATYRGLINGITRELGLLPFDALTIDIKAGSDGFPESPRIVVDTNEIILYNKWEGPDNYSIDKVINTYNRTGNDYNGYYIEDLISEINSSIYFTATIGVDVDGKTRSSNLIKTSSDKVVASEAIPPATSFRLENENILEDTLFFEETEVFQTLKATETEVVSEGDYYVNFDTGRVVVKTVPSGNGRVRYIARNIPFVAPASPIFAVDFKDQKFREEAFRTETLDDGTVVEGIPKAEAVDIINELFSIKEMYWGK